MGRVCAQRTRGPFCVRLMFRYFRPKPRRSVRNLPCSPTAAWPHPPSPSNTCGRWPTAPSACSWSVATPRDSRSASCGTTKCFARTGCTLEGVRKCWPRPGGAISRELRLRDELRRRNEVVKMPSDDLLNHHIRVLLRDDGGVEIVLPQIHGPAEMFGQERDQPRREGVPEDDGA